jgi:hypothetical protein
VEVAEGFKPANGGSPWECRLPGELVANRAIMGVFEEFWMRSGRAKALNYAGEAAGLKDGINPEFRNQ